MVQQLLQKKTTHSSISVINAGASLFHSTKCFLLCFLSMPLSRFELQQVNFHNVLDLCNTKRRGIKAGIDVWLKGEGSLHLWQSSKQWLMQDWQVWALPRGVGGCCWSWEKRIPVNRLGLQSCRDSGAAQESNSTGLMWVQEFLCSFLFFLMEMLHFLGVTKYLLIPVLLCWYRIGCENPWCQWQEGFFEWADWRKS